MLQPDLFFAYGLSSALALSARDKLKKEKNPWLNRYFVVTVAWLVLGFVPQVLYLLFRFPAWESMFVAQELSDYPAWFIGLYSIAIPVMGALGFSIAAFFLKREKPAAAIAQAVISLAIALILCTIGWDGSGYKRLLYTGTGADWANGVPYPPLDFFTSTVFFTLSWLEALLLIPYAIIFLAWNRKK